MTNEELLNAVQEILRKEFTTFRSTVREEVNVAISASEQRMRGYIDERLTKFEATVATIDGRLTNLEATTRAIDGRLTNLEATTAVIDDRLTNLETAVVATATRLTRVEERLTVIESTQRQIQGEMISIRGDLVKVIAVLDEASTYINELRTSQHNLENKVDDSIAALRRTVQKIADSVQLFSKKFSDLMIDMNRRLTAHEYLPLKEAHPHSAA
jgi:uncharacterized coiled-coil protein SlyX